MSITIPREFTTELRETVEDSVEYIIADFATRGHPISGETAYKVLECLAVAKQLEFQGELS